jgi:hypothetical protein
MDEVESGDTAKNTEKHYSKKRTNKKERDP